MSADDRHDWEIIAQRDPYFGVVSAPEFRSGAMTPEALERFYQSGEADIDRVLAWFAQDVGARPSTGRALDIGCGVGRLVCAMAKAMPYVSGYDVSETMIAIARERAPANVELSTTLPAGPFSWINSYIVFQHIPPDAGLALLETALSRATPDAFISIQITAWRDGSPRRTDPLARANQWLRHRLDRNSGATDGLIRMHDYHLSEVMRRIVAAGFSRTVLRHTNHGGHHGVWIIGRRG